VCVCVCLSKPRPPLHLKWLILTILIWIAYFTAMKEKVVGLWGHHAVCAPSFQLLNQLCSFHKSLGNTITNLLGFLFSPINQAIFRPIQWQEPYKQPYKNLLCLCGKDISFPCCICNGNEISLPRKHFRYLYGSSHGSWHSIGLMMAWPQ